MNETPRFGAASLLSLAAEEDAGDWVRRAQIESGRMSWTLGPVADLFWMLVEEARPLAGKSGSAAPPVVDHRGRVRSAAQPLSWSAMCLPISRAQVAAGEGALRTWTWFGASSMRKSWSRVPSGSSA